MLRLVVTLVATVGLSTTALAQATTAPESAPAEQPAPDTADDESAPDDESDETSADPSDGADTEPAAAGDTGDSAAGDEPSAADDASAEAGGTSDGADASATDPAAAEASAVDGDAAAAAADAANGEAQADQAATKAMSLEEAKKVVAAHEAEEAAKKAAAEAERKKSLWYDKKLSVGATALGLFNRNFVGQADGIGLQLGAIASGEFKLGFKGFIWKSNFDLAESLVVTPGENLLAPIVGKAADRFQGQTEVRYQYPGFSYVGPFARSQVQAVVLPSWVLRQQTTRVVKSNIDADPTQFVIGPNLPIGTTGWFEPLTFSETAGVLVEPPAWKTWVESLFRVSAAAQHQLAWGGHVVTDNPDTPELELSQVAIVNSAGVQAEAEVGGTIVERVGYSLKGAVYYPVIAIGAGVENVSLIERTHVDVEAKTSLRLAQWLSLDAVVLVRRQPFVINDWQLQTSLLITSTYSIF